MLVGVLHFKKDFGRVQNRSKVKNQTLYGSLEICICSKSRCKGRFWYTVAQDHLKMLTC